MVTFTKDETKVILKQSTITARKTSEFGVFHFRISAYRPEKTPKLDYLHVVYNS